RSGRLTQTTSSAGAGTCFLRPCESRMVIVAPQVHSSPVYFLLRTVRLTALGFHRLTFRPTGAFSSCSFFAIWLNDLPSATHSKICRTHLACSLYFRTDFVGFGPRPHQFAA